MSEFANPKPDYQVSRCSLEDCEFARYARGYCRKHYKHFRKNKTLGLKPPAERFCTEGNCANKSVSRGLCQTHSAAERRQTPFADELKCRIEGCGKRYHARRLCVVHYRRMMLHGDPLLVLRNKNRGCLVNGCSNPHSGFGYCGKHHRRFKLYGDANRSARTQGAGETPEKRFWSRTDQTGGEAACWNWRGAVIAKTGYGQSRYRGSRRHAHRVAWLIERGELPEAEIRQICGNRLCCNPAHLKLKT